MALSYLQEAQLNARLIAGQLDMKQDSEKQLSPPLNNNNNNTNNNNNNNSGQTMFSGVGSGSTTGLSMLTPQQLLAASRTAALMAAGIPVSLHATLAASPQLYRHHQSLFSNWVPPAATSPPPPLLQSPGPVSPALSAKSSTRRSSNNSSSVANNNNNNIVSSTIERINKKQALKRKMARSKADHLHHRHHHSHQHHSDQHSQQLSIEGPAPLSPPASTNTVSPESNKDSRDKVFTCGVCSRSFGYKHVLQNHERTHTGEKPFECPECHKRFTRDHHLKTHMRLHTGEKPYHCSHCDRQFVQVANLRRHLRVHTGERPYACELCSAKFSDSNQLKAHLLIHKGEKPFVCDHCQMRFRRRHHLLHHKCGTAGQVTVRPQVASPSLASDDLEDDTDIDIDGDVEMAESEKSHTPTPATTPTPDGIRMSIAPGRRQTNSRQLSSAVTSSGLSVQMPIPINLSGIPVDLPEQTEPEDLSMSTGMHRLHSHSHSSGDSPMSHSPSSDLHDEEDEELDVSEASPSSLFLQQQDRLNYTSGTDRSGSSSNHSS